LARGGRGRLLKARHALGELVPLLGFEVDAVSKGFDLAVDVVEPFVYLSKVFTYGYEFASTKAGERIDKTVEASEACLHAGEAVGRALFESSYLLLELSLVYAEKYITKSGATADGTVESASRILEGWASLSGGIGRGSWPGVQFPAIA
jgi:hypothetical protein